MENNTKKNMITAAVAVAAMSGTAKLTATQIVRAWESPEYRQTLTLEQQAAMPSNPAGDLIFQDPNSAKIYELAGTQYGGCDTQYGGCGTQYGGCDTQYGGCDTQYGGCATQFAACVG